MPIDKESKSPDSKGFDREWFDELRSISEDSLAGLDSKGFRPTIDELVDQGIVSRPFMNTTLALAKALNKTPYPFPPLFRAYERHIVNFPKGRAFRKQWNIGFYAGEDPSGDSVRIGLGFSLNTAMSEQGIDEYADFAGKVAGDPAGFNRFFSAVGGYCEPFESPEDQSMASIIINDSPRFEDDWRFFGKLLTCDSQEHQSIIASIDSLTNEIIAQFNAIENFGFGFRK